MIRKFILLFLFVAGLTNGCSVIDPVEEIPSYIRIDSVNLVTNSQEGSNSHAISDVWVYIDGELIGGFELPCNVPVLSEGTHTVLIRAGIKQNGLSSLRAIYPFYKGWESTISLTRGQSTELSPVFSYFPGINFLCQEPFGTAGTTVAFSSPVAIGVFPESFENTSAHITLNSSSVACSIYSSTWFDVDPAKEMYVELNYRNTQPFDIGLSFVAAPGDTLFIPWLSVTATENWNKIYVRLNDALTLQPTNVQYRLQFKCSNPASVPESHFWFDNIKWIND